MAPSTTGESGGRGSGRIPLGVETYSGYAADERPLAIRLGDRRIPVRAILDRWYGEDHAYFKLIGEDGALYIIRQDRVADDWDLILMEVPGTSPVNTRR